MPKKSNQKRPRPAELQFALKPMFDLKCLPQIDPDGTEAEQTFLADAFAWQCYFQKTTLPSRIRAQLGNIP
ncbi:MAG: hypothetical protein JWO91_575 [Acidobacteriaceae bacterium]|nr:hypothetical protein [Acidobacteriaceae bacterium]